MKTASIKLGILILLLSPFDTMAADLSAQQILERVDQVRSPGENFIFSIQLRAQTRAGIIENEFDVWVRESKKSLVLYRKPTDQRGRALLLDGNNMWIFVPGTSRALRISPQQQLVGVASNADVARVSFHLDYAAEGEVNPTELDSQSALKMKLTAKDEKAIYRTIEIWTTRDEYRPLRADFFSLSGKLIRTIEYQGYQMVLGEMRPMELKITDALRSTDQAVLTYSKFQIKETPAEYFQPAYLSKLD